MPLASCCSCTVLLEIVSLASAPTLASAHVAMPSSPVLRMPLLVTVELVTPPWKLMPSAVVSRMRMPLKVRPFIGPSIQAPTFLCSIQTFDTGEVGGGVRRSGGVGGGGVVVGWGVGGGGGGGVLAEKAGRRAGDGRIPHP